MADVYGSEIVVNYFTALMAIRTNPIPELIRFTGHGLPEQVNEYSVIGHGEPYGSVILKNLWNRNMKMTTFARLACFVIKYIQDMKLDNSVGINPDLDELPQVWYIPNVSFPSPFPPVGVSKDKIPEEVNKIWEQHPIRELDKQEVEKLMVDFDPHLLELKKSIKSIKL
jgi:hypothetical protein